MTGYRLVLVFGAALMASAASSQAPFKRTGQVFLSMLNSEELVEVKLNSSSFVPEFVNSYPMPNEKLDAIGFRKTDNILYGLSPSNNHLFSVGADGVSQDLGLPALNTSLQYLAGDVSPDGKELVCIGSTAQSDVHLARINLEDANYPASFVSLFGFSFMSDIAFDPYSGKLFGYDSMTRNLVEINPNTGVVTVLTQLGPGREIMGLFFDAFGEMYGYGRAVSIIVEALFHIDKDTGHETVLSTGPITFPNDAASCPFSIEMKSVFEPNQALPCTDVYLKYQLANGSGETADGLNFVHDLPPGFYLSNVLVNPFGMPFDTLSVPGTIRLNNMNLSPGVKTFSFKIKVGDIPKGVYKSQAFLENLLPEYGLVSQSDNPLTAGFEDSTTLRVNRFEEDSIFNEWLICHGETLVLDASEYGNSFVWNDGATTNQYEVTQAGLFFLEIGSACEQLLVSHSVTSTACPFTISLLHSFYPDTLFACNTTVFRYILKNDSGEKRENVTLTETLPAGFSFVDIIKNPYGGFIPSGLAQNMVELEGMTLEIGTDTIDVLVQIGDVTPGNYQSRAVLGGLPQLMGPIRYSDNPSTISNDSSSIHILGTLEDTLYLDTIICLNSGLVLDATPYGISFLWEDGSTGPSFPVKQPGTYHLILNDGCEPVDVFWQVNLATQITLNDLGPYYLHQGESLKLKPVILNQSNSLYVKWHDPLNNSLTCLDCLQPVASPLTSTVYSLQATNLICSDTVQIEFQVDETRRVYAPNTFSPNGDGINDFFYLQSPDDGIIHELLVADRWGNIIFQTYQSVLNEEKSGWGGSLGNEYYQAGLFVWKAVIEFVDGNKQSYSGNIAIMK